MPYWQVKPVLKSFYYPISCYSAFASEFFITSNTIILNVLRNLVIILKTVILNLFQNLVSNL